MNRKFCDFQKHAVLNKILLVSVKTLPIIVRCLLLSLLERVAVMDKLKRARRLVVNRNDADDEWRKK